MLIASLVSEVLVDFVTSHISGSWKLIFPSTLEVLTIVALLTWAKNRNGYTQVGLLLGAWITYIMCYLHLELGGHLPFFYNHYESIIKVVAVGQLAACYDTLHTVAVRMYHAASNLRFGGRWILRDSTLRASFLHGKGGVENQAGR